MKYCNKCNQSLDISFFAKNKVKKDGYQVYCKKCQKIVKDLHYQNNKKSYFDRNKKQKNKLSDIIKKIKISSKCIICGESEPCSLDFHHKDPKTKNEDIAAIAKFGSIKKLMEEIEKCIVVCSNCHRKIHSGIIVL